MPAGFRPPETEPDVGPFAELLGGEQGAPAFQSLGGRFETVPRAEVAAPTELGAFADLLPPEALTSRSMEGGDLGQFQNLIPAPKKPETESEAALAETPTVSDVAPEWRDFYDRHPTAKAVVKGLNYARNLGVEAVSEFSPELSQRVFGQTSAGLREEEKAKPLVSPETAGSLVNESLRPAVMGKAGIPVGKGNLPDWAQTPLSKGLAEGLAQAISGFSNPASIAQLPAFAVPGVAEVFVLNTLSELPDQGRNLWAAIQEHGINSKEVGLMASQYGINDLMAFFAAKASTLGKYRMEQKAINAAPSSPGNTSPLTPAPGPAPGPGPTSTGTFVPSTSWQEIPKGVVIPEGGRRIVDGNTGKIFVKWDADTLQAITRGVPEGEIPSETARVSPEVSNIDVPESLRINPELDALLKEEEAKLAEADASTSPTETTAGETPTSEPAVESPPSPAGVAPESPLEAQSAEAPSPVEPPVETGRPSSQPEPIEPAPERKPGQLSPEEQAVEQAALAEDSALPDEPAPAEPVGITETIADLERRNAPSTEPVIPSPRPPATRQSTKVKGFQGRGNTPEQIYGPEAVAQGRAVPILGKGDYIALTEKDAGIYGKTKPRSVELQNPLVIESGKQWHDLVKKAGAEHLHSGSREFYAEPHRIPEAATKLQKYLKDQGHDGVIVKNTAREKRLRESFGHDQAVKFPEVKPETPVAARGMKLRKKAGQGGYAANLMPEVIEFGKSVYRKGMEFAEWSAEMVKHLGEKVKEHLKTVWDSFTGKNMLPNSQEGGGIFGGGKTKRRGTTPKGDSEFLYIPSGPARLLRGLERHGAADILGKTKNKVGQLLSKATNRHTDLTKEIQGQLSATVDRSLKRMSRSERDSAFDELSAYEKEKENGRPTPTLSPKAQKILTAWEDIAESTGKMMAANDVKVKDPKTGKYRPTSLLGRSYLPRMFKDEVSQALKNPRKYATVFNKLVDDVMAQRGITEQQATKLLEGEAGRLSSSGFMGAIDMARSSKMPESFYDYDLRNVMSRYIPQFSERMAQIVAYGQRLGPREAPLRKNLWDIAKDETGGHTPTQEILNVMEDQALNVRPKTFGGRFMTGAQTLASGLYLSSPVTTLRNLVSGLAATPELMGAGRSTKALIKTMKRRSFDDAREVGVIQDSIATALHADKLGDGWVHNLIRGFTDKALKFGGQNPTESFVRTHGFISADLFVKDAVKNLEKLDALTTTRTTPTGTVTTTRRGPGAMLTKSRAKEALGLFKRLGIDAEKIVAEKGDWRTGPETRKFIRTFVDETQGGYRFNQVPLWANSNTGRFLYQFGRWGAMRARNIARNAIGPALGEKVTWKGKTMRRVDFRPLVKMAITPIVLGETFAGISQLLFGRDRRDASMSEIQEAWNDDEISALKMAGERIANDMIMAGTLGIWSQLPDWAKGLKDQSRLKNPAEPPGLGSINALKDLGQKAIDQDGTVTKQDILAFASAFAPGVKQYSDIARNVMGEKLYEAQNDVKTLRAAAHRWGESAGLDVAPRVRGDFRKSVFAPEYEPIKEALLVGDADLAKLLKREFVDKQANRGLASKNLKSSIRMSQPFRAGPYNAAPYRQDFMKWAEKNLNGDDLEQVQRIQERYKKAAVAADLW